MRRILCVTLCATALAAVLTQARPSADDRKDAIARAQVWQPTDVAAADILNGPAEPGGFTFRETVTCDYVEKDMSGRSPKFACRVSPEDDVKVKFGGANGEVYAEVAATRLLWALGFGADRMYPVRIVCRGCPREFNGGIVRENGEVVFDPAVVERKMPGREISAEWSWTELDRRVDEEAGGAPRAHRDALKLLAVLLQHSDNKSAQQRVLCLDPKEAGDVSCQRPLMMLNDVGLTFGRATPSNANSITGMNLTRWSQTPVWRDAEGCVGNLRRSFTGTLEHPRISEAGRQFLADLLMQLTDKQIDDLFTVARVTLRPRTPDRPRDGMATVAEWAAAFKQKRTDIVNRRCA